MIHDAIVPVTCDNEQCEHEQVLISLPFIFGEVDIAGVELHLGDEDGWHTKNGKHYCSEQCASEAEDAK